MPASEADAVAYKLMPFFVARFIANGNVYDPETNTRTKFADKDLEALEEQYGLDKNQCNAFVRKAYFNHKSEASFRNYIGVDANHEVPTVNEVNSTCNSYFFTRVPLPCGSFFQPATCCHICTKTCIFNHFNIVVP